MADNINSVASMGVDIAVDQGDLLKKLMEMLQKGQQTLNNNDLEVGLGIDDKKLLEDLKRAMTQMESLVKSSMNNINKTTTMDIKWEKELLDVKKTLQDLQGKFGLVGDTVSSLVTNVSLLTNELSRLNTIGDGAVKANTAMESLAKSTKDVSKAAKEGISAASLEDETTKLERQKVAYTELKDLITAYKTVKEKGLKSTDPTESASYDKSAGEAYLKIQEKIVQINNEGLESKKADSSINKQLIQSEADIAAAYEVKNKKIQETIDLLKQENKASGLTENEDGSLSKENTRRANRLANINKYTDNLAYLDSQVGSPDKINAYGNAVNEVKEKFNQLTAAIEVMNRSDDTTFAQAANQVAIYRKELEQLQKQTKSSTYDKTNSSGTVIAQDANIDPSVVNSHLVQMAQNLNEGTIASQQFNAANNTLKATLKGQDNVMRQVTLQYDSVTGATRKAYGAEKEYISLAQKWSTAFKTKIGQILQYVGAIGLISAATQALKNGLTIVKDLDDAMTNMKKVTDETAESYANFQKQSIATSKEVGSTASELMNSAADWSKVGYDLQESMGLAKNTALYMNVADIASIDSATQHLTSTLMAYNLTAEDSLSVVDKFNAISNNFSITADGLGAGLERAAAALVAAGNSLDQSMSLITVGNAISQDPEKVATGIKTMSLRIRGAVTELKDMGEEVDSVATSTSELRNEIKKLTGVDIMLDEDTFKSTYDIITELGKVWGNLTDLTQANVLESLAGKNQASVVAGLLANYQQLEEVTETAMNSAGSATQENEAYLDSMAGRIELLKAQLQELWANFYNNDVLKSLISLGTELLGLVDDIGLLNVALGTFGGILASKNINATDIFKELASAVKGTNKEVVILEDTIAKGIVENFNKSGLSADAFAESVGGLDEGMQKYLRTQKSGEATTAGYASYVGSMGKAFDVAKIKALALNVALNAMTMIGIGIAIQGITSAITYFTEAEERAAESAKKTTDAFNESQTSLKRNKDTIDSISKDYSKLSKGVDNLGRNVNLTTEEYERYNTIVNQIAEMFPSMVTGYTDQGDAIIGLKGDVEALTEAYEKQAEAANAALIAGSGDVWKNFKNNTKSSVKDIEKLQKLMKQASEGNSDWNTFTGERSLLKEAGIDANYKTNEELEAMLNTDSSRNIINSYISTLNTEIETQLANVKPIIAAYIDQNTSLTSDQKSSLKLVAGNLSSEFYKQFENSSQAFDWIGKNLIAPLKGENSAQITKTINDLFKLDPNTYSGSYEDYVKYVQDLMQQIQDYLNLDENTMLDLKVKVGLSSDSEVIGEDLLNGVRNNLLSASPSPKEILGAGGYESFKKQQQEISNWITTLNKKDLQVLYSITPRRGYTVADYEKLIARAEQKAEEASPITIETEFSNKESGTNKAIDEFQDRIETLKTALDKLRTNNLTENEILDLIQEVPELSLYVNDLETGINNLMGSAKDDALKALDEAISNAASQEDIDNFNAIKAAIEGISDESATIDLSTALANLEANGELTRQITSDMKEYGYVATETLQSIIAQYPQLESAIDDYLQGKKTEKDLLESLSQAYETDFDNYQQLYIQKNKLNVDFYNDVVKNLSQNVIDSAKSYGIDFTNYKNTAEAKLRLEKVMAQKVAQLRRAQAQADADVAKASTSTGSDQTDEKNQMIAMESYEAALRAKKAVEGVQEVIDAFSSSLDEVSAPNLSTYTGLKGQDSSKSKKKSGDKFSKTYDWVEVRIKKIQETAQKSVDAVADYITSKAKNLQLNTAIGAKEDEKSLLETAKKRYEQEAKNVGLAKKYRDLVDKGGLKIETIKDEKLANKIDEYQKWSEAAKGVGDEIKAINDEIKELNRQKLDNISAYWDSKSSTTEARVNNRQSSIDLQTAKGRNVSEKDYKYLINRQKTLLKNAQSEYAEYEKEMNKQIKAGTMKVGSEDWKNATAYLLNLQAEINNTKIEIEGLNDSIDNLPITLLDNKLTQLDNARSKIENSIAEKEANGETASTKDYKSLISNSATTVDVLKEKNNELVAQQKAFLKEGGKKTDQGYIDLETQIQANADAISNCRVEQAGWNADMRNANWKWLDRGISKLNSFKDQLNTLSGLISGDLIDDDGSYTNAGITQLGLYAQQLSLAEDETKMYQKAINQLNRDLANGVIPQEQYNEEMANYTSLQNQAILSTKQYRDAIIDLKKEAIEAQIDAFKELTQKRKDDLAAQREADDYAKSMNKSQEEIDKLQKQIAKLGLSSDRKSIAQRLELEQQLRDKQEEMSEKQADHDYDTKIKGLDDEMEAFEKIQKDKIKSLNNSLDAQEAAIKESLGIVQSNYDVIYGNLNTLATDYGMNLSDSITSPWESAINAAQLYKSIVEGISTDSNVIGDFGGTSGSSNQSTSRKAKIQAIISNGQGQGKGSSELNEYIKSMGYEQISYTQMAQLANILGVSGVTPKSIEKDTAKKKEILRALKNAGFSRGGIVGDIKDVIKGNGDTGIATVHRGEGLVPVEATPAIKELVANVPVLNKSIGELTNLKYIQPTAPSVTISYDQLIRVDGSVDKSIDIEGIVQAGIDKSNADLIRILKQYK